MRLGISTPLYIAADNLTPLSGDLVSRLSLLAFAYAYAIPEPLPTSTTSRLWTPITLIVSKRRKVEPSFYFFFKEKGSSKRRDVRFDSLKLHQKLKKKAK